MLIDKTGPSHHPLPFKSLLISDGLSMCNSAKRQSQINCESRSSSGKMRSPASPREDLGGGHARSQLLVGPLFKIITYSADQLLAESVVLLAIPTICSVYHLIPHEGYYAQVTIVLLSDESE
jgi:hypothetical protein